MVHTWFTKLWRNSLGGVYPKTFTHSCSKYWMALRVGFTQLSMCTTCAAVAYSA